MEEIIKAFEEEKGVLEKLIELDNKINHSHITYQELYQFLLKDTIYNYNKEKETLFITEGNPFFTISILKSISNTSQKHILFVFQRYLGINKWLIARYNEMRESEQVYLDCDTNYYKYFNKNIDILPIGEEVFIEEILHDFKEQEE